MAKDDTSLLAPGDLGTATGLLTRLPVRFHGARGARAAWAYPLAGLFVAVIAAIVGTAATAFGLSASLAAGLVLTSLIVTTGAMHEDGLADTADGLWGGWDRDRRLAIMKDSRTGAYGVIALILSLLLRWQALTLVIAAGLLWPALLMLAMLSRAMMVALMHALPHARDTGLSQSTGRPAAPTAGVALALGALSTLLLGFWCLPLLFVAALTGLACAAIARAKIGGQTGDILGATQQITEITLLLTLAALAA